MESYFSYYNDEFTAGGVQDAELFSPEEQNAFLPKDPGTVDSPLAPANPRPVPGGNIAPYSVLQYEDIRILTGIVIFVLALTSTPVLALVMIGIASLILPLPCLVIGYCAAMQIMHPYAANNTGMAIVCTIMSIVTIIVTHVTGSVGATTFMYIVLGLLFAIYAFRLTGRGIVRTRSAAPACPVYAGAKSEDLFFAE
ncbi:phosphorylated IMV membrane protein [Orf virus]|uniref:Phosphorylated IMV membrane protein n=1 Tax=Orf virus TaxID=10258 RepID=A0A0R8HV77_ORFV|nr:phosphorylated IMV membrane protein [Orf virus]AKU76847.1 phosphorylated IMV membrane protein [Orf virus]AYM26034.1 phosphorylated IMv membrane protein [Orf virus]QLI57601.1 phosphorylated IMV membrane protein [Orf virus]WGU15053.1 phosphorylated IMV membrane protein [Orf virus]